MIYKSILGVDGLPSSKKLTALWFVFLISLHQLFLMGIESYILYKNIQLSENQIRLIDLANISMALYLLGSVLAIYGVSWGQQASIMKILNPPPPDKNTIVQTGSPVVNVEENKPNEP